MTLPRAVQKWLTDRDAVWVADSNMTEESCVTWGCTLPPPGEYD